MAEGRSVGSVSVSVVPDASGFVEKLRAELEPGSNSIGDAIGRRIGSSMADSITPYIEEIRAKLDLLGSKDVRIRVKLDDGGSIAKVGSEVAAVDAAAGSGGGGFNIFGGKILAIGGAAVAAADIAIPAILAIGAAAAGALAGVAVLGLGFSGIGAALEAHGKSSGGGGGGGSSSGLALQSAQINATQATQTAQDNLTSATEAQVKAEKDLHDARVQALQDLQDLDNKLKDNTISQAQAAINLHQAQATLAVTLAAPGASQAQYADQVAQARLNVAAAQQKVNELTLTGTRLAADDAKAHKDGVANNPGVLDAQQKLIDANHKLAEAQANIGITAQKNAIALAQAAASASAAAGGTNAFADAMAKLNPIQQQFVNFLLTLKPLLDEIKLAASGFLPGLEQGFKNAAPAFGPIVKLVGDIAKAMGTVFANIGAQFATPQGQKFLAFLSTELPQQIIFLGNLFIDLGKIVSNIFEAAGPLIKAFDDALLGSLDSLGKTTSGGGLQAFFNSLIPLIKPTFQFLSAFGGVVTAALKAIAPALPPILDLFTKVADAIATLISGPVGQGFVQLFIDLVQAVEPLVPLLLNILQTVLPPLETALDTLVTAGIGPLIIAIVNALTPVLPPLGKAITDVVNAFAPLLPQLIQGLVPILGPLSKLLIDVLNAVIPLIPQIVDLFKAFAPLVKPIGEILTDLLSLVESVMPFLPFLISAFGGALKTLAPVLNTFATLLKPIAETLQHIADLLNTLSSYDSVLGSTLNLVTNRAAPGVTGAPIDTSGLKPHKASGGPVFAGMTYRANEFGDEMFIPRVDGTIINAVQAGHYQHNSNNGGNKNYYNIYGQSDPVATSHQVANRQAARGV